MTVRPAARRATSAVDQLVADPQARVPGPVPMQAGLRVGIVRWQPEVDELSASLADTVTGLGHAPTELEYTAALPESLDAVIACGPYGPLVPLARRLLRQPASRRPALVVWQTEQFWNPALPRCVGRPLSIVRSAAERAALRAAPGGRAAAAPSLRWLLSRAHRYRYLGDLLWLQRQGLLSVLAVGSRWNAAFLTNMGLRPIIAYVGAHPGWGADLRLERDIAVLWFGTPGSARRQRLLATIGQQLERHGIRLLLIDGVQRPFIFGQQRTEILNRTRIVLNLLRQPWDENAMRYYVAAPNRAAIVTEPTLPHVPFVHGQHLIEAPIGGLVETIRCLLADERQRVALAEQAHDLVTTDLTMARGVARVLDAALHNHDTRA